ncbi:MAG: [FeFe] hydrogenase H-cluster radical SAM maturase HydE [Elusimicrobiaceae bacterium]|nr:[FeFe] hydrogenase H-cluster radical SAM maturase HydE [Elusimicrobiaceae bacterium]
MNRDEIIQKLSFSDEKSLAGLYGQAYRVKTETVGRTVYFRGLIEMSNVCVKNCYYCGIRKDNAGVTRFTLDSGEIIASALWAYEAGYGSVVLQSGERASEEFIRSVELVLAEIKSKTEGKLAVTLSLGEQTEETYGRWLAAGAARYLLRIETSNPALYARLHPKDHSFDTRLNCLKTLRKLGYQTGTGVMTGLPFQTVEDLANDIIFFRDMDIDMIGMGPYIPHAQTPLAAGAAPAMRPHSLEMGLKMIAVARLVLPDINIAATTALQALSPAGRELGLKAGANVIMPNITDTKYRAYYQLYDGKPCLDENAGMCRDCLEQRIKSLGEEIAYFNPGTPLHYTARLARNPQ